MVIESGYKLLPCPFCGCEDIEQKYDNAIRCTNFACEAEMNWGHFAGKNAKRLMADAWNKRVDVAKG
jgi:hypothetical protein